MCAAATQQKAVRGFECASMARPDLSMICDIKVGLLPMQLFRSSDFGPLSPNVGCRRSTAASHAYPYGPCKGRVAMAETGLVWHLSLMNIKTVQGLAVRVDVQCLEGSEAQHTCHICGRHMLQHVTSGWLPSSPQQTQRFANEPPY